MNRRELAVALSSLALLGSTDLVAQTPSAPYAPTLAHSQIFALDQLPANAGRNGMVTRPVLRGTLATGEFVEVHETTLPPGQMPHPPHRHTHSEFLLIREGRLEVDSDGRQGIVEPGGVAFTASGVLHGLKNVGSTTASYFVVAVGRQQAIE